MERSSTSLPLNIDDQWWINGDDGVCKTVSNTGEIKEHDCVSTSVDPSLIRKPLCQLGSALQRILKYIDNKLIIVF